MVITRKNKSGRVKTGKEEPGEKKTTAATRGDKSHPEESGITEETEDSEDAKNPQVTLLLIESITHLALHPSIQPMLPRVRLPILAHALLLNAMHIFLI